MNIIPIIIYSIYSFIFIGMVFHTSSNPQVFDKYTFKYFFLLLLLILPFFLINKIINWFYNKTTISFNKRKIKFTPQRKILLVILLFILLIIIPIEMYLRYNHLDIKNNPNILTLDNYHPFLQHKLTEINNADDKNLHINSYGFRSNVITKQKPKGVYRIFVMGGSTVLNRSVPFEKNFVYLLEKDLQDKYKDKKIEVINAGNDGYTSEHTLIDFMFKIKDFDPDMLIVLQGVNDMTASCTPLLYSHGSYQPDYSHFYGPVSNIVFSYFNQKPFIEVHSILFDTVGEAIRNNLYSDLLTKIENSHADSLKTKSISVKNYPSIASYERNTQHLINLTKSEGIRLILANQPYQYTKGNNKIWFVQKTCETRTTHPNVESLIFGINLFNKKTQQLASKENIPFVDVESNIPKNSKYFIDDVHFTQEGNKKVAATIYQYIINADIIE